jgi:hypothetical protein
LKCTDLRPHFPHLSLQAARNAATEAYEAQQARYEAESVARTARKESARERLAKEKADKARRKEQERAGAKGGSKTKRPPFNFEAEKPRMMASVGQGTQSAQACVSFLSSFLPR